MKYLFLTFTSLILLLFSCSPSVETTTTSTTTTTTIYIHINDSIPMPKNTVNLVFIHQEVGKSLLSSVNDTYGDGHLALYLNKNNYYVTDITSGWNPNIHTFYLGIKYPIGDYTKINDMEIWFNPMHYESLMKEVYLNNMQFQNNNGIVYENIISKPSGNNEIIIFKPASKSCDMGDTTEDEVSIYKEILNYTMTRTNKLFIFFTPPPKKVIDKPERIRWLSNYLSDEKNGWLKDYTETNVGVFDLYNVLTHEKNLHTARVDLTDDVVHN
ncbi:MAG TPA: hypothetical protein PLO89_10095, partial [Spirochaetota bacterium]|nr:hypothetical protein [Spirochaetota bacterium]